MIYRCVDKTLAVGVHLGLKGKYHRLYESGIIPEARAWVVSVACTEPKNSHLAAEMRTISAFARSISQA